MGNPARPLAAPQTDSRPLTPPLAPALMDAREQRGGNMRSIRSSRPAAAAEIAVLVCAALIGPGPSATAHKVPRWVKHVQHWDGGLSNGVRERAAQAAGQIVVSTTTASPVKALGAPAL